MHLKEIALLFLKIGLISFGGPAAHTAMMEDEIVTKRKWMSRDHFLDLVGATNLIPGPNSTEMAIHCGYHRAGAPGLITAGICFILPAVTLTAIIAYFYANFGKLPEIEPLFYGIRPAVIVIILNAVIKLGKKSLKSFELGIIGSFVVISVLLGLSEVTAIIGGGIAGMIWLNINEKRKKGISFFACMFSAAIIPANLFAYTEPVRGLSEKSVQVFLTFLKIGLVLFGSGYVLIAYLDGEVVDKFQWLTRQQLMDCVAIGQFTPGPILSASTFIGYQIDGIAGAVLATTGVFLPSFVFVALINPLIPKLRKSVLASKFLDSVNISAVGVMAAVTFTLAKSSLTDWKTTLIFGAAMVSVLIFKKIHSLWLVVGGAVAGFILYKFF